MDEEEIIRGIRKITEKLKCCPVEGERKHLVLKQHGYLALLLGDVEEGNRLLGG